MSYAFRFRLCQFACIALLSAVSTAAQQVPEVAAARLGPIPPAMYRCEDRDSSQTPAQAAACFRIQFFARRSGSRLQPVLRGLAGLGPLPTRRRARRSRRSSRIASLRAQRSRQREQAERRVRSIADASPQRHRSQDALHTLGANRVDRSRQSPENPRSQFRRRAQRAHSRPEKALDQTASRHAVKQSFSRTRQRGNSNALLFRGSELQLRHELRRAKRTPRAERSEVPCARSLAAAGSLAMLAAGLAFRFVVLYVS